MRGFFFAFAFAFTLFFILTSAHADQKAGFSSPHIQSNFDIPSYEAEAARLKQKFKLLSDKYAALLDNREVEDLDDALKQLNIASSPEKFITRYRRELAIHDGTASTGTILALARDYANKHHYEDALGLLHILYQDHDEDAAALTAMAEIAIRQNRITDALNLDILSLELKGNPNSRRRVEVLLERLDLKIKGVSIDNNGDIAQACLQFSQDLENPEALSLSGYIRLEPEADTSYRALKDKICIRGLNYGTTYHVTIKAGLKGADHGTLIRDVERRVAIGHRQPRIILNPGSYVLPKSAKAKLPIRTVNVDEVELSLYRVGDRNLTTVEAAGLITSNISSWSARQLENEYGTKVSSATLEITGEKDQETTTLAPIQDLIETPKSGIYILTARDKAETETPYFSNRPTQWLIISDTGISSYQSDAQMQVHARSLTTAKPLKGVAFTLLSRGNDILGTAKTNRQGIAEFPAGLLRGKGGDSPYLLLSQDGDADFNFLTLSGPSLDLSELGTSGAETLGPSNAFIYTERGVYRPGEDVYISALLRDYQAKAIGDTTLSFKITRPDGVVIYEKRHTGDGLGGYTLAVPINAAARAGRYDIQAFLDPEGEVIGQQQFQVEDFVPQRISAALSTDAKALIPGEPIDLLIRSEFLYGAPASDLKTDGQLTIYANRQPFKAHQGFVFGPEEEDIRPQRHSLSGPDTDAQGIARISYQLNDLPRSKTPLEAGFRVQVSDISGRPVGSYLSLPIHNSDLYLGLKREDWIADGEGAITRFTALSVDAQGDTLSRRKLTVDWFKEHHDYNWYYQSGQWQVRTQVYDEILYTQETVTSTDGVVNLEHRLPYGRYRLQIRDAQGKALTSRRFYVGWTRSSTNANTPDQLDITIDRNDVEAGGKIRAFIKAPFSGQALIAVATDKIQWTKSIDLDEAGAEISIPMKADWRPGAYILATAYRPDDGHPSLLPHRAMGMKWVNIDRSKAEYQLALSHLETVKPNSKATIDFKIKEYDPDHGPVKITLAAVDEGILQLTGFKSPDPQKHFLTQRRLGVDIRDLYGRLIKAVDGKTGHLRFGGDASLAQAEENITGLRNRAQKTIALFEKDIHVDKDGHGSVMLDIPDFTGRLRLMAVAYGKDRLSSQSSDLVVRDDLVSELLLPRFLSPGDEADAKLSLHNLKDEAVALDINIDAEGLLLEKEQWTVELAAKERRDITVKTQAGAPQDAQIKLTVAQNDKVVREKSWSLPIRAPQPYSTSRNIHILEPGQTLEISNAGRADFYSNSIATSLKFTNRPDFDVADLLHSLDRYPYGCTEQTISRAMPLLYLGDLAVKWDVDDDPIAIDNTIQRAIDRIANRQNSDGSFGLWASGTHDGVWLTAYSVEFLIRARDKGHDVPLQALEFAKQWLKARALSARGTESYATAYAYYVLAREVDISLSETLYFAEQHGDRIKTALGLAHMGAALGLLGELEQQERYFVKALKTRRRQNQWYRDYGSDLRDQAAIAALIADLHDDGNRLGPLTSKLEERFHRRTYFSTQEQSWLTLTAHALAQKTGDAFSFTYDAKAYDAQTSGQTFILGPDQASNERLIQNTGDTTFRVIETRRGISKSPLKATSGKLQISRQYLSLDGQIIDPMTLKQNDLIIVLLHGRKTNNLRHDFLVVDLLPAGLEIENAAIGGDDLRAASLPVLTRDTAFEAARDDRYIAALAPGYSRREFRLAYLARAVTPGRFTQPAPFVEDMNRPDIFARGESGELVIAPR